MEHSFIAFTKHNPKYSYLNHPEEDSFRYLFGKDKMVVVVADGVARDPIGVSEFPDNSDKEAMSKLMESYPRPSPAKKASDTFCNTFIKYDKKLVILDIFKECNNQIKKLNKGLVVDYLENDFAACVASGGIVESNILYYGFIGDCGVCVYDEKFQILFRTSDEVQGRKIHEEGRKLGKNRRQAEWRARVRSHYRNNKSNSLSYGALTGESSALHFIKTGKINVKKGNTVIFYSDGMAPLIYSEIVPKMKNLGDLENYIAKNLEEMEGTEGTIVAIKI
ncbi:MAG: hypothetical protein Q7S74_04940 [Nanoarchaeota archaeon]|nr:hypothetical protein [Nanoarchaeota archaeon]